MQPVNNKSYPATDPVWKHGKKIDAFLKDFPVVVFSVVPDSRKGKSGEQSKVVIHFSYLDYDIFEVSCDKNITKLLCIEKQKGTRFEKIFSNILINEKFKHPHNLKAYLKEEVESSDAYLLFIRPVEFEVKGSPEKVLTPTLLVTLTHMLESSSQYIMNYYSELVKTKKIEMDRSTSAVYDIKENPVKKIKISKQLCCYIYVRS